MVWTELISARFVEAGYLDWRLFRISDQCHIKWFGKSCLNFGRLLRLKWVKLNFLSPSTFRLRHPINSLSQWNMHFLPLQGVNPTVIQVGYFRSHCKRPPFHILPSQHWRVPIYYFMTICTMIENTELTGWQLLCTKHLSIKFKSNKKKTV